MSKISWYLEYKKNPHATQRLFCFHHSGGSASFYHSWLAHLAPSIELIAIQFPGRENRFNEPLTNNLKDIILSLTKEFHQYTDKPFFVFGHSLGALIGFELIQAVYQAYTIYPRSFIVSAAKAPHLPFKRKYLSQIGYNELKEELKIYNGIDERILQSDELLDLFLPIIKSDFSISENYHSNSMPVFPFDILALSGEQDHSVALEEIMGWGKYTTEKFEHILFPGDHFYIKSQQKSVVDMVNKVGENHRL